MRPKLIAALLVIVVPAGGLTACTHAIPAKSSQSTSTELPKPKPKPKPKPILVWSDEFSGTQGSPPNPSNWVHETGGNGWGNGELECYTDGLQNSQLNGAGQLVISAEADPRHVCGDGKVNDYTSARLSTKNLETTRYGRIEMRAVLPIGVGVWPAFWALGADPANTTWPAMGEIDIVEVAGNKPSVVHGSLHGPKTNGKPYSVTSVTDIAEPVDSAFHTYAVDWTPTSVSFSIDDRVFFTATKATVQRSGAWVYDHPFYLLLNVAVGGAFGGAPTAATTWPRQMVVDYVRIFKDPVADVS